MNDYNIIETNKHLDIALKKNHTIIIDHYKCYPCDLPDCFQMFEDFHWICCV